MCLCYRSSSTGKRTPEAPVCLMLCRTVRQSKPLPSKVKVPGEEVIIIMKKKPQLQKLSNN